MAHEPDTGRIEAAVRALREELGMPDHFELQFYEYGDTEHINFNCRDEIPGVERGRSDKYRLEAVDLGETTEWALRPVDVPREL